MATVPEVLLTEDRAAMSDYQNNIQLGYLSCVPANVLPRSIYHRYFVPRVPADRRGVVKFAPLPLRIVESVLLNGGFKRSQVELIRSDFLDRRVKEGTKIVGLSTHDPLGLGPGTTTLATIFNGEPHNRLEFAYMMSKLRRLKKEYDFKVVLGGTGAWQLMHDNNFRKLGVDYLFIGEAEYEAAKLFHEIINDTYDSPRIVFGKITKPRDFPIIQSPTNWGLIELTRGCGRGCLHCAPNTAGALRSVPLDIVLENAKVNLQAPYNLHKAILLQSDDSFRYGAKRKDGRLDPDAIFSLYDALFDLGAKSIHFTHASFANLVADEEFIMDFSKYLRSHGIAGTGCQPGLETGSVRLMSKLMHGKMRPYSPEEWPWVVQNGIRIMCENGWVPVCTLILGLPGETREDIIDTYELIQSVRQYRALYMPLFFVPMGMTRLQVAQKFISQSMTKEHWQLLTYCWKNNLEHIYTLYDGSDAESPPLMKAFIRAAIQIAKFFLRRHGQRKIATHKRAHTLDELEGSSDSHQEIATHGCDPDICHNSPD